MDEVWRKRALELLKTVLERIRKARKSWAADDKEFEDFVEPLEKAELEIRVGHLVLAQLEIGKKYERARRLLEECEGLVWSDTLKADIRALLDGDKP